MSSTDRRAISVVVRSIGRPTLDRALASIATQRPPADEIVVVGASGARHPPVPERFGATTITLLRSESALSRAAAADAGMRAARAEWITYLDDDDEVLPGHLAGLMESARKADGVLAVTGRALARFRDGRTEIWGQRFALAELFERNFVHLSTLLFHRSLRDRGVAFDPALDLHEDWDFVLQVAQHTRFADWPQASFLWHADAGSSGGGGGANTDTEAFVRHRDYVYAKWAPVRDRWVERCAGSLQRAAALAASGRFDEAAAEAHAVLEFSQNDPHALNLLAMLAMHAGDTSKAVALATLATEVRPQDADIRFNLAKLHLARGHRDTARATLREALTLNRSHAGALALMRTLGSTEARSHASPSLSIPAASNASAEPQPRRAAFIDLERHSATHAADKPAARELLRRFIELGSPDDLPGASLSLPPGDRPPRIAVITPYAREPLETLERCRRSVLRQTLRCEQIFVADGFPHEEIDGWGVRHLRLPVPSQNYGDTPRRIGGESAIEDGFDAVVYLDADNWLRPRHVESLFARHRASGAPVCHSARTLHRLDGTVMPLMLGADNVEHVDTNCLFVASRAFDLLPLWGTWPAELSRIDDRVFWRLVTARGHASAFTGALTTCYEASHFSFYRTLGEVAPAGTRPDLDLVALFAWHEGIAAAERADLDERLGFSVASLLASLCPPALAR